MSVEEKAHLLITAVTSELKNGLRHYDPDTKELLVDVKSVLTCLATKKEVIIVAPRMCACGHREYEADKVLCTNCGSVLSVEAIL